VDAGGQGTTPATARHSRAGGDKRRWLWHERSGGFWFFRANANEDDQPCDGRIDERQSVNGLRRSGRNSMAERDQILGFDVPRSKAQAAHDATNS
jgi:hypothetical protein